MKLPSTLGKIKRRDLAMLVAGGMIVIAASSLDKLYRNHQTAIPYQSAGVTAPWIPSTVKYWHGTIDQMGKKYNVDSNLIAIIMTLESGGYAKADSGQAEGLMQITPVTAKDIASKYLKKPVSSYNLWDPKTNIEFGTAYLAELRKLFQQPAQAPTWDFTVERVAASYNAGFIGGIHLREGKGIHDLQALQYSGDAFNMWRERHVPDSPTFDRWKERGGSLLIKAADKAHQ